MRSAKDYFIVFLACTTVTGGALAWRQYQELIALRAAVLTPREPPFSSVRDHPSEPSEEPAATKNAIADAAEQVAEAVDAAEPGSSASVRPRREGGRRMTNVMDDPEVQKLMAVQRKASLDHRYAALFRTLNLSPAQLDQLKNLLVDKSTAMADVMAVAREQGINRRTDPAMFNQLVAEAQEEIDADIRATLGEVGYAQYQEYERTLPQRGIATQLEQRLSYTSTPLTPDQSAQLVKILAANSSANSRSSGAAAAVISQSGVNRAQGALVTDAAINQALGTLAAPQLEALRELQREQQVQAELGAAMRQRFQRQQPASLTPAQTASPTTQTSGG